MSSLFNLKRAVLNFINTPLFRLRGDKGVFIDDSKVAKFRIIYAKILLKSNRGLC